MFINRFVLESEKVSTSFFVNLLNVLVLEGFYSLPPSLGLHLGSESSFVVQLGLRVILTVEAGSSLRFNVLDWRLSLNSFRVRPLRILLITSLIILRRKIVRWFRVRSQWGNGP
jgi:hypothetical protein